MENVLSIRGAREHNLKNIDLSIPKNKLIVFTGISGSGKSSLAFDTIFAEGQRRYVESLSSYARQFLGVMDKPDVDSIEGLSPAISIDQKSISHNPRSTVGTVTEIYDYLRLLFARIGHPHCPSCGREIARQSAQQIVDHILSLIKQSLSGYQIKHVRFLILAPVIRDRKGEYSELLKTLKSRGFSKVRIDGAIYGLDEDMYLIKTNKHTIDVVVDRLSLSKKDVTDTISYATFRSRLNDSVEQALSVSDGLLIYSHIQDAGFAIPDKPKIMDDHLYSERFSCPVCNISLSEIEPRMFSFNSPHGACPTCTGIGNLKTVDPTLVINPRLSITEGGILPFASLFEHDTWYTRIVKAVCKDVGIDIQKPLGEIPDTKLQLLLHGTGEKTYAVSGTNREGAMTTIYESFPGVIKEVKRRYHESQSDYVRIEIEKFMRDEVCPDCDGVRLKKESLGITIGDKSIVDITRLPIKQSLVWVESSFEVLSEREKTIATPIMKEIRQRLTFLVSVGLEYLTLDRTAATLAGGEAQRIRLASQIGSGLSGVLYVLDEPSIGLHQRDNDRLIKTLKRLRDLGNTVIVVEHDRDVMEESDVLVDFGPGAGEEGGRVVAIGTPQEIKQNPDSLTGKYLSGSKKIRREAPNLKIKAGTLDESKGILTITRCSQFNLKSIDVSFPLGKFICVTGVSGSGKSTLIVETLYHALATHVNPFHRIKPGAFSALLGTEAVDKVILIDQSPIGRTPRSNPATYTGVFTDIRAVFAQTPEAKMRGYKQGRFSFNVKGGRCEVCAGEGEIKIEMQFLADVYVRCESCNGSRFNRETLEVHFKGKSIRDCLQMTVLEAHEFFSAHPSISDKLGTLLAVGLGYIHLGQSAPTLSGGEAQRVKLATHLSRRATGKTVYILDEPTTGLHFADLEKLIEVLQRLVATGNTVIVIEHNLDVIKNADWIIDLGPEGGDEGGKIVTEGSPAIVAKDPASHTGHYLRAILK